MISLVGVVILMLLTATVVWYFTKVDRVDCCCRRSTFVNMSSNGYYFDTTNLTFISKTDREMGIKTLIRLLSEDGVKYTPVELASLSDSFILTILESEDDTELAALKARVSMVIDPTYHRVFMLVQRGAATGNALGNDTDRRLIYDILVKYFNALNTPIMVPMARWSDSLLIKTFGTLRLPESTEYVQ